MKTVLTALILLLGVLPCSAQDNQWAPAHQGTPLLNLDYIVDFNPERGVAHWVAYELLPAETLGEAKRKSSFRRDDRLVGSPVHKDYTYSGYDRGHLKPAADSRSSEERMGASFLMTNVAPQTPQLNRGSWKQLEEKTRDWAHELGAVYVVCGPGTGSKGILPSGSVEIPSTYWKAVLRTSPDTACIAFSMPNSMEKLNPFSAYRVTVDSLERFLGIDLFPQLPDGLESRIENEFDSFWSGLTN